MLTKFSNLLAKLAAFFLGALAVSAQAGNTLICVSILFLGPAVVLGLMTR
jgi:hypothetical protein